MIASLVLALSCATGFAPVSPALRQVPAGQSPTPRPSTPPPPPASDDADASAVVRDPAEVVIKTPSAVILVPVKATLVADYESAITLLQEAFSSASDDELRTVARGWTVMKADEADSKGNVVYLHLLRPVVAGVDYRPSVWLDRLVKELPLEVLDKYRDALAGPASLLSLTDLAAMSEPPAPGTSEGSGATPASAAPSTPRNPSDESTGAASSRPVVRRPGGGPR